ncbi:porin [Pseudomonas saliphila]|uniref:porin n=1 Tax=Pseudomonas saliphila TaxID=2586906 RepID=UPI00123A285C|nr:porin [Pseudomonas saliphila]
MNKRNLLGLAVCLASTSAMALEPGEYRFNGFGTAAITHLGGADDAKGYGIQGQTTDAWRGDQLSKLGGQLSYGVADRLSATIQTVAKAEQDQWNLEVEWAYLAYQVNNQLTLRAGRLRPGAFMFSETLDVGYSYPWLRLPDEVYSQMPVSNYEGVDALYSLPVSFGTLNFQVSYGQATDREVFIHNLDGPLDVDFKEVVTGSVSLATMNLGTLRYSYTESDLNLEMFGKFKGKFESVGHQYDNGNWLTNAEAIKRQSPLGTIESFYLMAGHRFGDYLPHVTYAQWDEKGEPGRQSSWAYGLNYSLTPSVTLKGEYKRVESTRGFSGGFVPDFSVVDRTFDGDIVSIGADFIF